MRVMVQCKQYTRVVGYMGEVNNMNKGKQKEFADRKYWLD